jgi:chaperonin GroES
MNPANQLEPITPGVNPDSLPSVDMLLSSVNIADRLDDDVLRKIGNTVVDGFETDESSRSEWMKRYENSLKLATQIVEHKSFPWQGAANIKYPLLTTACIQFSARAYPSLVTGKEIVLARTTGFDPDGRKTAAANRVSRHMSYQVLEEMEEWEEDMDRLLVMLPCTGTEFKKSYYDPIRGRNVSEHVLARELVVNYWAKSLETAVRKTHILYLTPNDIRERVLDGIFLDHDLKRSTLTPDHLRSISDMVQGLSPPFDDEDAPFKIMECHTWLDLDEDDYKEPYIITVDHESRKVLRITARFDQEGVKYGKKNKILRIKPVEYFTKFSFIPSIDGGFYDFGWGHLLGPINETVNTTINQLLDAGTLSNMQSGFLSRGIRLRGGDSKFKPGEWKMVDTTGDDLRKGIFPMPVQQPSNVLFQLLGTMTQAGERLSNVVDILMGENPGQNQPATTTMAVIEQGLKVFTAVYKRLFRSLKYEYRKLYRLNRVYLPQESYFRVLDMEQGEMMRIGQSDYQGDPTDVQPAADPNMVSEAQRLVRAQALVSSLREGSPANPLEIWKRYYEAMRIENPEKLLPKELPPPPPDPKIVAIEMEDKHKSMEHQLEQAKLQLEQGNLQLEQSKLQLEQDRLAFDQEMARFKAHAESQGDGSTSLEVLKLDLERERQERELAIKEREMAHEREMARVQEENRLAIEKLKIDSQERMAQAERDFQNSMKDEEKTEEKTRS